VNLNELDRKFAGHELEFRPSNFSEKTNKALALVYVKLKPIEDRLDEVCGKENWSVDYEEGPLGGIIATLGIRGVAIEGRDFGMWTHKSDGADATQFEAVKGGLTDAFKRVARRWGVGRYLHDVPQVWIPAKKSGKYVYFEREWTPAKIIAEFEKQQRGCLDPNYGNNTDDE
jgi:hypothetical protein